MLIDSPDYDIRYSDETDGKDLEKWLQDPLTLSAFPAETEQEKTFMLNFWVAFTRFRSSLTATFQGAPCGMATIFLMPYKKVAHHAPFYLIVDPTMRHEGIGFSLLKNIKHLAKTRFHLDFLHMELWGENKMMVDLLKDQGFTLLMSQKGFVKENGVYLPRTIYKVDL